MLDVESTDALLHQAVEEAKRREEEAKRQVHKIGYPAPETCLSALADNHNITSCVCVCVCVCACVCESSPHVGPSHSPCVNTAARRLLTTRKGGGTRDRQLRDNVK